MQTALPLLPGVIVRASTSAMRALRLIEVADRHGWPNGYVNDAEVIAAAHHAGENSPAVTARLDKAAREAFDWLAAHAVPDGMTLMQYGAVIVVNR